MGDCVRLFACFAFEITEQRLQPSGKWRLAEEDQRFSGAYCLHYQGETTWRHNPQSCHIHTRRRKNLNHLLENA
jgi:hypothetical protein